MEKHQYYYHIITFGCQMNKSDSERIETILQNMGLLYTDTLSSADVIVINTCSVRETAEARVFGYAKNFVQFKEKNPELIVCVTGCMPGRDKKNKMGRKLPGIDLYFPTKEMIHLPLWLYELNPNLRKIDSVEEDYLAIHPTVQKKYQTFVTLQTGCNHFCSYCVVPHARGLEVNRPLKDILDEVHTMVENGALEVTLLGQIVNHYVAPDGENFSLENPYTESDFAKLLWELNQIEGLKRITWTAPHPLYMTDEVIDALTLPKQLNFIHLPVQSGNSDILQKMNRRHTREFYLDIIEKIRQKKPDIAIGTDLIVGFCGETEDQFEDTLSLYDVCDFDLSYNAQYSERSGTLAQKTMSDDVRREKKKERWLKLQEKMKKIAFEKNQKYNEERVEVLVEDFQKGWCIGNSREMKKVSFLGSPSMIGTLQYPKIIKADTWMLYGELEQK
ncbi:MAG: tRNA (N6-isopentenyl adenosine(37)-C2)-methylthiotransferase MiaB [Candidatus Magasanikbacteria bacterium]